MFVERFSTFLTLAALMAVSAALLPAQTLTVTPSSLQFDYTVGGKAPADKELTVTASGGSFTVAISTLAQSWLKANPVSVTASTSAVKVGVAVEPGTLRRP